jgi:hypothetical protein
LGFFHGFTENVTPEQQKPKTRKDRARRQEAVRDPAKSASGDPAESSRFLAFMF